MKNIQGLPDEMSRHLLTIVRTGARRMNRLISQILMLVQIDSGAITELMERQTRPTDVNAAVKQAWATVLKETGHTADDVQVTFHLAEQPLWVEGVPEHLASAFGELFRNALVFDTPMVVTTEAGDGQVVISVRDAGPGIPHEMQAQLWDRFSQIEHEGIDRQGSGLGLAIVREVVRLHRGNASLESEPGEGTMVTIRLPEASEAPKQLPEG